jgi:hypothetical protein
MSDLSDQGMIERIQAEVQEIAEVLTQVSAKSVADA